MKDQNKNQNFDSVLNAEQVCKEPLQNWNLELQRKFDEIGSIPKAQALLKRVFLYSLGVYEYNEGQPFLKVDRSIGDTFCQIDDFFTDVLDGKSALDALQWLYSHDNLNDYDKHLEQFFIPYFKSIALDCNNGAEEVQKIFLLYSRLNKLFSFAKPEFDKIRDKERATV
jgi:hypothetical protein